MAAVAAAQTAPEPPVFQSTTRVVQVNVVVHGRDRKPVGDLKKEDFQLSEDGKPQQISFFSVERGNKLSQPNFNLPRNVFSNRVGERIAVPTSVTVILLDMLNTSWADQIYARRQVSKFLSQIQPGDRVALYALGKGLHVLHDYTTDASELVANLNSSRAGLLPDLESSTVAQDRVAEAEDGLIPAELLATEVRMADFIAANRVLNTLKSIEAIAEHLAAVPGRKSLVWVSGGFPLMIGFDEISESATINAGINRETRTFFDKTERTVRALNHANVALYPVDARGLMTDVRNAASNRTNRSTSAWTPPHLDTMSLLADRTGGKAYYNSNDIAGAVREVFIDAEVTYTIGYYSNAAKLDGKFRDVKVKVNRPGMNVRHRKGYFALADLSRTDDAKVKEEMRDAMWSPLDATAVAVNARVDRLPGGKLSIYVQIEPDTCVMEQKNGRYHGRLDIGLGLKDDRGRSMSGRSDTLNLQLLPKTFAETQKKGILYHQAMDLVPNATALRVVVRDATSGLSGSITIPLSKVEMAAAPVTEPRP